MDWHNFCIDIMFVCELQRQFSKAPVLSASVLQDAPEDNNSEASIVDGYGLPSDNPAPGDKNAETQTGS